MIGIKQRIFFFLRKTTWERRPSAGGRPIRLTHLPGSESPDVSVPGNGEALGARGGRGPAPGLRSHVAAPSRVPPGRGRACAALGGGALATSRGILPVGRRRCNTGPAAAAKGRERSWGEAPPQFGGRRRETPRPERELAGPGWGDAGSRGRKRKIQRRPHPRPCVRREAGLGHSWPAPRDVGPLLARSQRGPGRLHPESRGEKMWPSSSS